MSTVTPSAPQSPALHRRHVGGALGSPRGIGLLFGAILLLGTALRLYGIASYPFEEDELYSIVESTRLLDSPLHPGIEARPLYYLLQHVLFAFVPQSHFGMRLLPLVFGVAGIAATWKLGRLVFGVTGAAVASFLVAVSPWHVHVSGMARYGAMLYVFAVLFLIFLTRADRDGRPADYLACVVALLLGAATHPSFLFPAVGVVVGSRLVRADGGLGWVWPPRRAWVYLWGPFLTAFAVAILLLKLIGREGAVRNFSGRGLGASVRLLPAIVEWLNPVIFVAGATGAVVVLVAATTPVSRRWSAAAFVGSLGTMLILLAASFVTNTYADYAVPMLPLVFVSAGGLVAVWCERTVSRQPLFAVAACLVLLAGVLPSLASHLSDGMRYDFRPAFAHASEHGPSLPLLTTPIIQQRHYAPALDGRELQMNRSFLDRTLQAERDFWIAAAVRRDGIVHDEFGEAASWVDRQCVRATSHEKIRFDFRLYRVDLFRCTLESESGAQL